MSLGQLVKKCCWIKLNVKYFYFAEELREHFGKFGKVRMCRLPFVSSLHLLH